MLVAAADAEALLVPGASPGAGMIPPLRDAWVEATDDGSSEHRLAVALGTARARERDRRSVRMDPVRAHFVPLDENGRLATQGGGLAPRVAASPRVVVGNASPLEALLAIVDRRLLEAESGASRRLPIVAAPNLGASLADVAAFLDARVDAARILKLARAYAAVRLRDRPALRPTFGPPPEDAWLVLRVAHLAGAFQSDRDLPPADPAIARRLRSGDAATALTLALRRLRAKGFSLPIVCGTTDPARALRWGAALAFPLSRIAMKGALEKVAPSEGDRR